MTNNFIITMISAMIGARLLYVLTNLDEFNSLGEMLDPRRGLVAYGGFLGGFAGSYFFLRRHKIALLPWGDVVAPGLASGLMLTRIGCYLFGCDFGRPLSEHAGPLLKKLGSFPHWPKNILRAIGNGSPAWEQHVQSRGLSRTAEYSLPVHPTQLYESLVGLGLLIFLLTARRHQKFRGQVFLLFVFAYGLCRYLLEIIRDDVDRGSLPLALPEHLLFPFGLVLFALSYLFAFSKSIQHKHFRLVTQVLAFTPSVFMFVIMMPKTFAMSTYTQFSTSQFIAIASAFMAAFAYARFLKKENA